MDSLSKLVTAAIVLVVLVVAFFFFVGIAHIEGHQLAIKETFAGGVDTKGGENHDGIYHPKRHFYIRGLTEYVLYDMRVHHFVMNDKSEKDGEKGEGRAIDSLMVQFAGSSSKGSNDTSQVTSGGQKGKLSLDLQWRYNEKQLLTTHAAVRNQLDTMHEKVIRNVLQRVVIDKCTVITALEAYYGESRVKLQKDIETALRENPELKDKGVVVDNFVMQISLDPKYEEQIAMKVVAYQSQQRFEAEKLANEKAALAEKAKAQIDANNKIVAAEAQKQVGILAKEQAMQEAILTAEGANKAAILAAEASNKSAILAAQAEQQKRILEATGESQANELKAKGVLALATATAQGEQLTKMAKYDGEAGKVRAQVELAGLQADKLKGLLSGVQVIPESAFVSLGGGGVTPVVNVTPGK
jgi:hypothetical protein